MVQDCCRCCLETVDVEARQENANEYVVQIRCYFKLTDKFISLQRSLHRTEFS